MVAPRQHYPGRVISRYHAALIARRERELVEVAAARGMHSDATRAVARRMARLMVRQGISHADAEARVMLALDRARRIEVARARRR